MGMSHIHNFVFLLRKKKKGDQERSSFFFLVRIQNFRYGKNHRNIVKYLSSDQK